MTPYYSIKYDTVNEIRYTYKYTYLTLPVMLLGISMYTVL